MGRHHHPYQPAARPASGARHTCACGREAWQRLGSAWVCERCLVIEYRRDNSDTPPRPDWAKYCETYRTAAGGCS